MDLRALGLDVWLDLSNIPPGEDFEARILPEIAERSHLVLQATPEAKESVWVPEGGQAGRESSARKVLPLRLAGKRGTMLPNL